MAPSRQRAGPASRDRVRYSRTIAPKTQVRLDALLGQKNGEGRWSGSGSSRSAWSSTSCSRGAEEAPHPPVPATLAPAPGRPESEAMPSGEDLRPARAIDPRAQGAVPPASVLGLRVQARLRPSSANRSLISSPVRHLERRHRHTSAATAWPTTVLRASTYFDLKTAAAAHHAVRSTCAHWAGSDRRGLNEPCRHRRGRQGRARRPSATSAASKGRS